MNTQELKQLLFDEGCNPQLYTIGSQGTASDTFCLRFKDTEWQVYYTERGRDEAPIYNSKDESQACEFFFKHIMAMRHDHCVGIFRSQDQANALVAKFDKIGITSWQDKIPYGGTSESRFRVFVIGKAIFAAKVIIAEQSSVSCSDRPTN
jgi:hypothetical protein